MERPELVVFIREQFARPWKDDAKPFIPNKRDLGLGCGQHHYGKCELRELLDHIYGGPPLNKDEEL